MLRRAGMRAENVDRERAETVQEDRGLLVPISVEGYAALLHQHAAIAFRGVKRVAREIAVHLHPLQFTNRMPASMDAGVYSSRRARRVAIRCGWDTAGEGPNFDSA